MGSTDYDELRAQTVSSAQEEEAVTVNTRALIDKVLARYSGEWTTLRELIQNAADATASKVTIKFETTPSAKVPLPHDSSPSALLKHTIQHHKLKRLVVTNNGQPFSGNDWSRLKRIAEGNPDETKIGAFGVGFYSVFAECEEPLVRSHDEAMAFYWKGNSLFTRTSKLSKQANRDTSFILDYRNDTTTIPSLLPLCQFLATSLTFVGIAEMELLLDDWTLLQLKKTTAPSRAVHIPKTFSTKTKDGLFKVNSTVHETSQLNASWLKVIAWNPKATTEAAQALPSKSGKGLQSLWNSITSSQKNVAAEKAAKAEREAEAELARDLLGQEQATAFLHVTTAQLTSNIEKNFARELERATKKPPPKSTHIALLTASHSEMELSTSAGNVGSRKADIFVNVLPRSSGRIFIGFPTHQTTGFGAHLSAPSVIPTVERESIDLNARWVRTWNEELLRAAGLVARIAWREESTALKKQLDDVVAASGSAKLLPEHIKKVLPQAIHNMNQFDFSESTPSGRVGSSIEEGFWDCDKSGGLDMDLLSTCGVIPSQDIRLGSEDLSFLEGIPFLPKEVAENKPILITKLIGVGVITSVVITDIKKQLEKQSLDSQQLIEFLQWIAKRVSTKQMDVHGAKSLLKVTLANDHESNQIIQLGSISCFQNIQQVPADMPIPSNTIPHKFTKNINLPSLAALGWKELQVVPWVEFLLDKTRVIEAGKRLDVDDDFATRVLPAISKHWRGLSDSSKQNLISLLVERTVIPTKLGLKRPRDAYFKTVKLFQDLPTINVSNVSDAFLAALGVRKTVELNLVFDRLLNPQTTEGSKTAWSHVELIKYLVTVRADIPDSDIQKLRETPICTAEGDSDGRKYLLSELFEPKDELRQLQVKFVAWPGLYRQHAEESKFMRSLGLQTHPTVDRLIEITASPKNDVVLRDHALRYLINFQHQHGYSVSDIAATSASFLPVDGNEKIRCKPSTCFTNSKAALFGVEILRQDLHPHAAKLGVKANPRIGFCVDWLMTNLPSTHRAARELFEYFASRMMELDEKTVERLSKSAIVPIISQDPFAMEKTQPIRRLSPNMCFLGRGGRYADILEYVDFGDAANAFLLRCGSKPEPTSVELARRVMNEPARILDTFDDPLKYQTLLRRIAVDWSSIKRDKVLVRQMKESSFLLASIELQSDGSEKSPMPEEDDDYQRSIKTWRLSKAEKIVVVDDTTDYNLFKADVLAAPQEEELESLYLALGASKLSSVVSQTTRIGVNLKDTESAQRLKKLVVERVRLFLSELSKEHIARDGKWLDENLDLIPVSSITCCKALKGHNKKHYLDINACYEKIQSSFLDSRHVIYFKPGVTDLFHLGQSLVTVCLNKTTTQMVIVLTTLLESNLRTLQSRGYNVSRILQRRRAEDKILQEEKQRHLEEEKARIQAALTLESPGAGNAGEKDVRDQVENRNALMPGDFPDSADQNDVHDTDVSQSDGSRDQQPLFTTLKERMKDMWRTGPNQGSSAISGISNDSETNAQSNDNEPSRTGGSQPRVSHKEAGTQVAMDKASMQAKLERTVAASRAYKAGALSSAGLESMIKETPSFCDSKPAQNLLLQGRTSSGMKVFCAKHLTNPSVFLGANGGGLDAFCMILLQCADAMNVPRQSLHIFQDEKSESIAFNMGQALFFNYHYFDIMHLGDVQRGEADDAIIHWFVTMCHETIHNICADHGSEFNFWTQNLIRMHFTSIAKLLANNRLARQADRAAPPPYRT